MNILKDVWEIGFGKSLTKTSSGLKCVSNSVSE